MHWTLFLAQVVVNPFDRIVIQKQFDFRDRRSHAERIGVIGFTFFVYVNDDSVCAGLVGRIRDAYE